MCLRGDLGSGKTTLVQSLAKLLGIKEQITSPTFVIMKNYILPKSINGIKEIVHVDAYRLRGAFDAETIGLSEYFERADILIIIEWPENIATALPKKLKNIKITQISNTGRKFETNFNYHE